MLNRNISMVAIILAATTTVALAHSGATGIVKERMDAMSEMGKTIKELATMMRGEKAYDTNIVRTGAALIGKHSGDAMTGLLPFGNNPVIESPECLPISAAPAFTTLAS